MTFDKGNLHYLLTKEYYGGKKAERSGLLYMNHIDEGLVLLDEIGASIWAKEGYCLHPIFQGEIAPWATPVMEPYRYSLSACSVSMALDYAKYANGYLSKHYRGPDDIFDLSPYADVNDMLIADKVQNRKDFERNVHMYPNRDRLRSYFINWLTRLGVTESEYVRLSSLIGG